MQISNLFPRKFYTVLWFGWKVKYRIKNAIERKIRYFKAARRLSFLRALPFYSFNIDVLNYVYKKTKKSTMTTQKPVSLQKSNFGYRFTFGLD